MNTEIGFTLPQEARGFAPLDRTQATARAAVLAHAIQIANTTRIFRVEACDIWRYLRSLCEGQGVYGLPRVQLVTGARLAAYYAVPNGWMTEYSIHTPDSGPDDGLWAAMLLGWHALHHLPASPYRFAPDGALFLPHQSAPRAEQMKARFCWGFSRLLLGY